VQVLRSDEGRGLRIRHQQNVRYLRDKLLEAGLPVVHTPSHIIPVHVRSFFSHAFFRMFAVGQLLQFFFYESYT